MLPFRSVLCAVDFSAHSRHALQYAAAIAVRCRGQISVLSVSDPLLVAAARASSPNRHTLADQSRIELARFVERSLRAFAPQAGHVTLTVAEGDPSTEILRAARRLRVDLIVLGSQGLTGVQRLFFGSTTAQVLQRSTVPVLAVPRIRSHRPSAPRLPISRVVAPLDLVGEWQADGIGAAAIARQFGVPLVLAHIVRPLRAPNWLRRTVATDRERLNQARESLEPLARRLAKTNEVAVSTMVVVGEPASEIARLTRRGAPLVVMSLRGREGVWGRRGSIAYHVITRSSAPVLALAP